MSCIIFVEETTKSWNLLPNSINIQADFFQLFPLNYFSFFFFSSDYGECGSDGKYFLSGDLQSRIA
jgi:hypothetical protein